MEFSIENRKIGPKYKPLVIAEIGINHNGKFEKAIRMIDDAKKVGCECVKFQCHIIEDEMIPNDVIPANAKETIWKIMERCQFSEKQEFRLKNYVESKKMIYLSTPFSRAAANRLHKMNVSAYKIGSGECNNYPLIEHVAKYKKPIILSTGMNNISSIKLAVKIIEKYKIPYALMHCTSMYPTPYDKVKLGSIKDLQQYFSDAVIGLSDHSIGLYTSFAAIALGASIIEKHFTSNKKWPGPDIALSITPNELRDLIQGCNDIHDALGGKKTILNEEQPTIKFAYACVVSIRDIMKGEKLSSNNVWVKRPGTGEIKAKYYDNVLGKKTKRDIKINSQIRWKDMD